ncbi:MAG: DUF4981 domain-containing protein [Bacteroidales bacterium]|nr:DUF4981 domain-containing protein [Bacteroidales bacterium]
MKKLSLLAIATVLASLSLQAKGPAVEDWQNPAVFERNRMPMRSGFTVKEQNTVSLNGVWKFHWNPTIEGRLKGFEAVSLDDSSWDSMPVPGMWELNGFGEPMYLNIGYPWRGHYKNNPPYPATENNYVGQYRRKFTVPSEWKGKQVCLCIGSATSNVRVWVNGKEVGYSQDSKLEARFDITKFVKAGDNLIALEIFRWCDGTYLEDQDFNRFAGISRGVYVYSREPERIEDVRVIAGMDGKADVDVELTKGITSLDISVSKPGEAALVSETFPVKGGKVEASLSVPSPDLWSAESPALYELTVVARKGKEVAETATTLFGFRTVEVRDAQLLVNGKPVLIKGVDRHEMNPYRGYDVTEEDMIRDIRIMKELNVNAVRTCHYPDDPCWLALCDRFGIYVVDEGNIESHGMGYGEKTLAKDPAYHDAHIARDMRMVHRDFNHPSVIIWSMGNEAGNGQNFLDCYDAIKAFDPSRPVQYERALRDRNTDIYCPMYDSPDACEKYLNGNPSKPLIQCEYAHAMGNSIGNFKEYWDLVRKYPSYQGGFIWDFVDQALYKEVSIPGADHIFAFGGDWNDYDPSDGSFNCNGVIAADRSLHPHAYEVRYQYRSIHTCAADDKGGVKVYNENFFIPLDRYRMVWDVEVGGCKVREGVVENIGAGPGETATLTLLKPDEAAEYAEKGIACLNVRYLLKEADGLLPAGSEVSYDQILLGDEDCCKVCCGCLPDGLPAYDSAAAEFSGTFSKPGTTGDRVFPWSARFDKVSGALVSYKVAGVETMAAPLMPNFNRAVTENDLGARMHLLYGMWRKPEFKVRSFDVSQNEEGYLLTVVYEPIGGVAGLKLEYRVHADGALCCTETMSDAGGLSEAPDMFRYGMRFAMPGRFSTLDFFGKGPWENYSDRNSAALLGHYVQSVNDQYHYGYVRTQESGTHTGMRWLKLLDDSGIGLSISSKEFSASALPFSIEDLDCAALGGDAKRKTRNEVYGESQHSPELRAKAHEGDRRNGTTYVCFELVQAGVGGIISWGTKPLEPYLVHPEAREFNFLIRPVAN